jgi:AcrR family transcriptional regulator
MMTSVNTVNPSAVVPRRERVRAATEAEIVETARAQLVEGGPDAVTLREVGRRMGMTASALYRYVEGHAGLVDRLAADLYEDLTSHLADAVARAAGPDALGEDVLPALLAASRAFRGWGLAHPAEFRLLFGGGRPTEASGCAHADAAGLLFGALWLDLFRRGAGLPTTPPLADVDGLRADPDTPLVDPVFTALPEPYREVFARSWVRLLGLVMVEVAGHHAQTGVPGEQLFEAELADLGETVRRAMAGP